jgi:hypothetical protein
MDDELKGDGDDDDLGDGLATWPQPVLTIKESPKRIERHF